MPFSGLCYLARCDLITERVWVYVKCRHCAINTAYKKKKTLLSYQYRRVHSVQKGNKKKLIFPVNITVLIYGMHTMRHKPYTERDIR